MLDFRLVIKTRFRLKPTNYAHSKTNIWSSAEHYIHETSNCRGIWNPTHELLFMPFLGTCSLESLIPCLKGNIPFLESCMENLYKILSMYEAWDNAIVLFFLSLMTWIPRIKLASPKSFISNCFANHSFTVSIHLHRFQ